MKSATKQEMPAVRVTREISASVNDVFRAWIEPELILKWFKPAGNAAMTKAEVNAHKGGTYKFEMGITGGDVYRFHGEFLEFSVNEKLVFSWIPFDESEPESEVTVEFIDKGTSTEIVLTHSLLPEEARRDDYRGGWTHCLDSMAEFYARPA
jgi:uncharacterized protein YndB with AHSA1/START domain